MICRSRKKNVSLHPKLKLMHTKSNNKLKWDDYSIRSTAYYQKKGGVYSQLLTILMNIKGSFQYRGVRPAHVILNRASYICDCYIQTRVFDKEVFDRYFPLDYYVALILILSTNPKADRELMIKEYEALRSSSEKYAKPFEALWQQVLNNKLNPLSSEFPCADSNEGLDNADINEIVALKAKLSDAESSIEKLQKTIQNLKRKIPNAEDRYFTFDILIDYARSRRHYHNAQQIINMIKDLLRGCDEKEVWDKVDALEQEMLEADQPNSIINNNTIMGSNVLTGLVSNPKFPIGVDAEEFIKRIVLEKLNTL